MNYKAIKLLPTISTILLNVNLLTRIKKLNPINMQIKYLDYKELEPLVYANPAHALSSTQHKMQVTDHISFPHLRVFPTIKSLQGETLLKLLKVQCLVSMSDE